MVKAIDLRLDFPADRETYRQLIVDDCSDSMHGYQDWRMKQYCENIGLDYKQVLDVYRTKGKDAADEMVLKAADDSGIMPFEEQMEHLNEYLDDAGVEFGCVATITRNNDELANLLDKYGRDRLMGIYYADPRDIMDGVRKLEYYVKERGLGALYVSQLRVGADADDAKLYPLYAKACELDIPVFSYSCMNFSTGYPMLATHPYHIDKVATDFPDLRLCVATTGWPWVGEFMALAMRHKNVYINMECYEPKYFTTPHFGFEPYLEFLKNGRITDKLCFASMASSQGISLKQLVQEVYDLPIDDKIKEKILHDNPARFLRRD